MPATDFIFDGLPMVAPDLKRRYKHGRLKRMVSILDTGSTHTVISQCALEALSTQTICYSSQKMRVMGVNGLSESSGSVILTGAYCPSPTEVFPFSVTALVNPNLSVDILVGNDLMTQVGLCVIDPYGRSFASCIVPSDVPSTFSGFSLPHQEVTAAFVKHRHSAFRQRGRRARVFAHPNISPTTSLQSVNCQPSVSQLYGDCSRAPFSFDDWCNKRHSQWTKCQSQKTSLETSHRSHV